MRIDYPKEDSFLHVYQHFRPFSWAIKVFLTHFSQICHKITCWKPGRLEENLSLAVQPPKPYHFQVTIIFSILEKNIRQNPGKSSGELRCVWLIHCYKNIILLKNHLNPNTPHEIRHWQTIDFSVDLSCPDQRMDTNVNTRESWSRHNKQDYWTGQTCHNDDSR